MHGGRISREYRASNSAEESWVPVALLCLGMKTHLGMYGN